MRKRLVFRVDDVGYTKGYDMGAFIPLESGIATSADVMFDAENVKESLTKLKEMPWISVGWHRHLWERPVLPREEVPSLVDENGRFKWGHRKNHLMAEATYEDARKEFEAQMKLCYEYLGRYPDTADTSNNSPLALERAFQDVVVRYGIPHNLASTTPDHRWEKKCDPQYESLQYFSSGAAINSSYRLEDFKDYNPLEKMTSLKWKNEEIYLYGWHPGYCDDHIMAESTCNIHRCKELQACMSEEFKNWIITNKIELINQRDVLHGTNEFQDHLKEIDSPLWIGNMK